MIVEEDITEQEQRNLTRINTQLMLDIYEQNCIAIDRQEIVRGFFKIMKQAVEMIQRDTQDLRTEWGEVKGTIRINQEKHSQNINHITQDLRNIETRNREISRKLKNISGPGQRKRHKRTDRKVKIGQSRHRSIEYQYVKKQAEIEEDIKTINGIQNENDTFLTQDKGEKEIEETDSQENSEGSEIMDPIIGDTMQVEDTTLENEASEYQQAEQWYGKKPKEGSSEIGQKYCYGRIEYWSRFKNKGQWAMDFLNLDPEKERVRHVKLDRGWAIFQAEVQEKTWTTWTQTETILNATKQPLKYLQLSRWSTTVEWWNQTPVETRAALTMNRVIEYRYLGIKQFIDILKEQADKEEKAIKELERIGKPFKETEIWNQIWPDVYKDS